MAAGFFTEDYRLGAVSGAAGGYERGQEKEGRARRRLRAFLVSRLTLRPNWNRSPFSRGIRSRTEFISSS